VRGKWDGNPQVYWGRERAGGPLILAGHNQWSRGVASDRAEGVYDFIANQSGKPKTPAEQQARQQFAKNFANLYPLFDAATPKDFAGFVYADSLFGVDPSLDKKLIKMDGYPKGVWTFAPNPKSNTRYYVDAASELGQRIAQAKVMVVGHGEFDSFGAPDRAQKPMDDFEMFNQTGGLIVQGPIYTKGGSGQDTSKIEELIGYVADEVAGVGKTIDAFISSLPDPDKNGIFYPFFNAMSNLHANNEQSFDSITGDTFTLDAPTAGSHIYFTGSTAHTLTAPAFGDFTLGDVITVVNNSIANIAIVSDGASIIKKAGTTTSGNVSLKAGGVATLMLVEVDVWFVNGAGI
jgi:hypothetical protein